MRDASLARRATVVCFQLPLFLQPEVFLEEFGDVSKQYIA
jgi:hypothetical protein